MYEFRVEEDKLTNGIFPQGIDDMCAVIDKKAGLLKYGEKDRIKNYYMQLLSMFHKSKDNKNLGLFGFNDSNLANNITDLRFIDFNELGLSLEYQARFINYMIEVSDSGNTVSQIVDCDIDIIKDFIDKVS